VDAAAIGFGFEALVFAEVRLETPDDFEDALAAVPNVVKAQRLFGGPTTCCGWPPKTSLPTNGCTRARWPVRPVCVG
jgi:hypothetical protein